MERPRGPGDRGKKKEKMSLALFSRPKSKRSYTLDLFFLARLPLVKIVQTGRSLLPVNVMWRGPRKRVEYVQVEEEGGKEIEEGGVLLGVRLFRPGTGPEKAINKWLPHLKGGPPVRFQLRDRFPLPLFPRSPPFVSSRLSPSFRFAVLRLPWSSDRHRPTRPGELVASRWWFGFSWCRVLDRSLAACSEARAASQR